MELSPVFTIGYGARGIDEFIGLLRVHGIQLLMDVRSEPYSGFKPEFSIKTLRQRLEQEGIDYIFMGDSLGGRPPDQTCYIGGIVDYSKVRERPFFRQGIAHLYRTREKGHRIVIMCSEGKPENCHRTKLLGEELEDQGIPVIHIDESGKAKSHADVINTITGGQLSLFDHAVEISTSRKSHRSS